MSKLPPTTGIETQINQTSSEVIDRIRSLPTTSGNNTKVSVETDIESTSEACPQPNQLMYVQSSTTNSVKGSLHKL